MLHSTYAIDLIKVQLFFITLRDWVEWLRSLDSTKRSGAQNPLAYLLGLLNSSSLPVF